MSNSNNYLSSRSSNSTTINNKYNNNNNSDTLFNIVHFGCWNYGGCNVLKFNPLSLVKAHLTEYSKQNAIDFYLIAGDNYYQIKNKDKAKAKDKAKSKDKDKPKDKSKVKDKDKKTILYNDIEFTEGFECLSKLQGHKYVLVGNHDTKSIEDYKNSVTKNTLPVCHTLHKQIEFTQKHNTDFTMIKPDTTQHLYLPHSKTLFVLLDTNLLQSDKNDVKEILECSIEYYNFSGEHLTAAEFVEHYKSELCNATTNYISKNNAGMPINNLVFVGHHPIYGAKSKLTDDNKRKNKYQYLSDAGIDLITRIIDDVMPESVYHLCADIHNYQQSALTINSISPDNSKTYTIMQYITGTGGASQDMLPIYSDFESLNTDKFIVNLTPIKSIGPGNYGFLNIKENVDRTLSFQEILFKYKNRMKKRITKFNPIKRNSISSSTRKSISSRRRNLGASSTRKSIPSRSHSKRRPLNV
jgi:hypothetical protein